MKMGLYINNRLLTKIASGHLFATRDTGFLFRYFPTYNDLNKCVISHWKIMTFLLPAFHDPVLFAYFITRMWLRYVRVFAFANPSVVCLSVTLVHPNRGVEAFGNLSLPLCTLAILWPPCKILRRSSYRGTPPPGALNLSLIHIWRCRRIERCRSRWSPYH